MSQLSRIGYTLLALLLLVPALTAIFNFFGISTTIYLPYVAWMVALGIFYAILPMTIGKMFSN